MQTQRRSLLVVMEHNIVTTPLMGIKERIDISAILRCPLLFVSCLGPSWDFIYEVLDLSMKVLSPRGWLRTLVKNSGDREAIALYEQQVKRLSCSVELSQEEVYITSYHENWVVYKIWKK